MCVFSPSDTSDAESLTDLVANTSGKAGQSGGGEVGRGGKDMKDGARRRLGLTLMFLTMLQLVIKT